MIKKIIIANLFFVQFIFCMDVGVQAQKSATINLMICTEGKPKKQLQKIAQQMQKDFSFTRQFTVKVDHIKKITTQSQIKNFFEQGYPLVLFLSKDKKKQNISWRLYDAEHAAMVDGKVYKKKGKIVRGWAHNIADMVWPALTGLSSFFSTKIAYCKEVKKVGKHLCKYICIADYDGSNEQVLIDTKTVNVAPRWNGDLLNPLVFYSEHTNKNMRLMVCDMQKNKNVVANFDGLNMLPAFSYDGKKVVFCASKNSTTCQLYYYEKNILKQLTNNKGNNISPTLSGDGKTIYFCSDYQTNNPQIYSYDVNTKKQIRLTQGGYCVSPSYCLENKKIAYNKMVRGVMQIFTYDTITKKHQQITFDKGSKEECSWSPCGNYLLFSIFDGKKTRIAMLNTITNYTNFITKSDVSCCYPTWSRSYKIFPIAL